ncbi:hypothetical protein CGRA01v4_14730 [Colletotrichum graminicola]|nr:hypothetical protein CGRA01v4_14730 [Colletotrichum graminicola]
MRQLECAYPPFFSSRPFPSRCHAGEGIDSLLLSRGSLPYAVSVVCQCNGRATHLVVDTHLNLLDGAVTAPPHMASRAVFVESVVVRPVAAIVLHGSRGISQGPRDFSCAPGSRTHAVPYHLGPCPRG